MLLLVLWEVWWIFVFSLYSRTSKGFSNQTTVKQSGCIEAYTETLKVFLHALSVPVHRQILHQGVRQFLHRMVVCLEGEILPFIPVAMENLVKHADVKELHDFIPFINQVVQKFKVDILCIYILFIILFFILFLTSFPSSTKSYRSLRFTFLTFTSCSFFYFLLISCFWAFVYFHFISCISSFIYFHLFQHVIYFYFIFLFFLFAFISSALR